MEKQVIAKGSREYVIVDVEDRLGVLDTLDGANTRYTIKDRDDNLLYNDANANNVGLRAYCLVDTTVGTWDAEEYRLYLKFEALPEVPILGPFKFLVDNG